MSITDGLLKGIERDFSSYAVDVEFLAVRVADGVPQPALLRCAAGVKGEFRVEFPDGEVKPPVVFRVRMANGSVLATKTMGADGFGKQVTIDVPPAPAVTVTPNPDPDSGRPAKLQGVVLRRPDLSRVENATLVVSASPRSGGDEPVSLLTAETGAKGFFNGDYPRGSWREAYAEVSVAPDARIPIALEADGTFPRSVILVVPEGSYGSATGDCGCQGAQPPRDPSMEGLVDGAGVFSADKGGRCVDFTVPNRTIEEYLYTLIVRTTDPEIAGLSLANDGARHVPPRVVEDIAGRPNRIADLLRGGAVARPGAAAPAGARAAALPGISPAPAIPAPAIPVPAPTAPAPAVPAPAAAPAEAAIPWSRADLALRPEFLRDAARSPSREALAEALEKSAAADARETIAAAKHRTAARAPLGPKNPLDWDEEPTFYQATTIAHGHLVQFRQRWKADGYSLGDLLYSLPLAPAQKKQVAIVDWERKETGRRSEDLAAVDQLSADLSRDRDIVEIVNGAVAETMKGASAAMTGGGGKGSGSSNSEGKILGVAGGGGGGASGAIQNANRSLAVNTLQQLHDRTVQAANDVRSQRSTVVQSVAQGEEMRVQTEVVANHNHCHAMTMEYFEVLRHFRVELDVAGVDECLFVPLLMSAFDEAKAYRWRSVLEPRLLEARFLAGFDAIDRIRNAYEGSDLPERRYADEEMESLQGELTMVLSWVRPADTDKGEFNSAAWNVIGPLLSRLGGPAVVFARYLADRVSAERDRIFQTEIVPNVIEEFVQGMRFQFNGSADAGLEATLISRAAAGVPLRVSLRSSGGRAAMARARVQTFRITAPGAGGRPDVTARAIVRSGTLRYRTAHREDYLFADRRIDNDLAGGDAVVIDTPLNRAELRNPREEDKEHARRLIGHLQGNLEYYHRALWLGMDAGRRYMLLDGVEAPGAAGRSVASVVENRVVAIVGNSLVLPVAPGFRLDPTSKTLGELLPLYAPLQPQPAVRVSVPTRGVFAEAVLGECNSCEKIDDTRFWRWEQAAGVDEPTAIQPVAADSRQSGTPDLRAKDFGAPIINLQNAPGAPDPTGLGAAMQVLGASNLFRDVTGLEGNQRNAAAAMAASLGAAQSFGEQASKLAAAKAVERAADAEVQKQVSRDYNRLSTLTNEAMHRGDISREAGGQILEAGLKRMAGVRPEPKISTGDAVQMVQTAEEFGAYVAYDGENLVVDAKPLPGDAAEGPDSLPVAAVPVPAPSNQPDFVPFIVYLGPNAQVWTGDEDGFRGAARKYHEAWGLEVVDVGNFKEFVEKLNGLPELAAGERRRVRFVSHASNMLWLPMFEGWPYTWGTGKELLAALVDGGDALMRILVKFYPDFSAAATWDEVAGKIKAKNAALAGVFGIEPGKEPPVEVLRYVEYRSFMDRFTRAGIKSDLADELVRYIAKPDGGSRPPEIERFVSENGLGSKPGREQYVVATIDRMKAAAGHFVRGNPTLTHAKSGELEQLLRDAGSPFGDKALDYSIDWIQAAAAAAKALGDGKFMETLAAVQKKLGGTTLDIRGCEVGREADYLEAVRSVLNADEVTAPDLIQVFAYDFPRAVEVGTAADLEGYLARTDRLPGKGDHWDMGLMPVLDRFGAEELGADWPPAKVAGKKREVDNTTERAKVAFKAYFENHRVIPVCEWNGDEHDAGVQRLYVRKSDDQARKDWLISQWGVDLNGKAADLLKAWKRKGKTSAVALLGMGNFVCSESGYRQHILSTKGGAAKP